MLATLAKRAVLTFLLTGAVAVGACSSDTQGDKGDITAGNQELQSGLGTVRSGIQHYRAGDTEAGLKAVAQGRGMMGQAVMMMGGGCCLFDGGTVEGGVMESCAAMMGPGMNMMLQGLSKFDGARRMMGSSDSGTSQAMTDMEAGMQMMQQGASQMMQGQMGSMGSMHSI